MILQELHGYIKTVETFDTDNGQDATVLHQYLIQLTNFMARANGLMAEYGRKARDQKKVAYQNLFLSMQSQKKVFSPMLANVCLARWKVSNWLIWAIAAIFFNCRFTT